MVYNYYDNMCAELASTIPRDQEGFEGHVIVVTLLS